MKLSNYRVKGRQIISIPIKKNKFSEDEYINNNYKIEINPNIEYNQKIYFKPPKRNYKNNNQIVFSTGSQKSTSTISSEHQNYNSNMLIYIPCLNCGCDILFDEIEQHSMICIKVKDEILKNEKSKNEFKSINYKLIKLKEHISQIIQGKDNSLLKNEFKLFGKDLYNIISKNINVDMASLDNIKSLKLSINELDDLESKNVSNLSLSSLIIFDRTRVLINEKIIRLKEIIRLNAKNKKKEFNQIYLDQSKNKIEEIVSDIDTKNLNNTNNYTSLSSVAGNNISFIQEKTNDKLLNKVTESNNDDENNIIEKNSLNYSYHHFYTFKNNSNLNEENKNENPIINEQEKKDFYKIILTMKFEKLHSTHLGQYISPKEIFNEAQKQNIPKEKWEEFILNELQNPYKYNINKTKNKNNSNRSINRTFFNQTEN